MILISLNHLLITEKGKQFKNFIISNSNDNNVDFLIGQPSCFFNLV